MIDTLERAAPGLPILSMRPPWAWAVVHLGKVENRTWTTRYRGWIWIHQGLSPDPQAPTLAVGELLLGYVIGAARLEKIVRDSPSHWAEAGMHHWVFDETRYLPEPLRLRGRQSLFYDPATNVLPDPETLPAPVRPDTPGPARALPVKAPRSRGAAVFSPDARRR